MKLKQSVIIMAALSLSIGARAQSVDEGIKMYNYERYQSAKTMLTPLAANNPTANYYLGLAELNLGDIEGARTTFSKYPDNYANASGLARVAFMQGNATAGMQMATALAGKAKKKDWEPQKYAADAITYTHGGDVQQAINWYKAATSNMDNADIHVAMGDAYQQLPGGGGEAMTNYEKATDKDPKNSLAFSRIGKLWYDAKNYTLALENWEKAKTADPTNPLPYCDLADAYSYVGKYDLSKENLEKCLDLSDKSSEDIVKYTGVLFLNKDYAKASQMAQDEINKGMKKPGLYGIVGASQYELNDAANKYGLENYRNYITTQDPAKVTANDYRTYAKILLKNNMGTDANSYLDKALTISKDTNKSDAYRQNAEALRDAREWGLAAGWYEQLCKEFPNDAKAIDYFYWGVCYYYSHNLGKASVAFEQMETKFPDQPSATYWRARTAAAVDSNAKTGEAIPFYTKWLASTTGEKKNADLMQAYQYLAIYYYNKDDAANAKIYLDKIEAIDPNNALAKQIRGIMSKPKAAAPAKKK